MWKAFVNHHLTAAGVQVVLLLLLVLLIWTQGSDVAPQLAVRVREPAEGPQVPVRAIKTLLSLEPFKKTAFLVSSSNPFDTAYFVPPPPKEPDEPKEPPKTRQIELTYQGFYQRAGGEPRAFVNVDGRSVFGLAGMALVGGLTIEKVKQRTLVLQNPRGDSIVLEFRRPKTVEIPR